MVMVFTLVSSAQEWLHTKYEEEKKMKEEREEKQLRELEEAERKRFAKFYFNFVNEQSAV